MGNGGGSYRFHLKLLGVKRLWRIGCTSQKTLESEAAGAISKFFGRNRPYWAVLGRTRINFGS